MLRDLKFFRRNHGKNPTADGNNENLPVDLAVSSTSQLEADPSRPPFNTIQDSAQNPKSGLDQETGFRGKKEKTPFKTHSRGHDSFSQLGTPDKLAVVQSRFGWISKSEQPGLTCPESSEEPLHQGQFKLLLPPPPIMGSHALNFCNGGGYIAATPRTTITGGRTSSVHSGTSSTQSTPTKSVTKPVPNGVISSRAPQCGGIARAMNFTAPKGMPMSSASPQLYSPAEVPHFELKEDPSFWMDHNVQVVVRIRPINCMERSLHGYSRCIKQENAQSITWIGQSENRFMFDYIACETINQEMLFRVAGLPMVENCMSGYNSCVFAYGQTGSGKTHTMLGEINDLETRPSPNRGMTPRIFEFLFARIKAEEESRRDEKLQYNCKCSFLEIYNEQIIDLLSPSSTNLLIREDHRKGVHVENLKEFEVETVSDIVKLLIQGAANRKVASTNMNRESSRSHSVFTCTIESRWEKDLTSTLRSARLNLVDLAGSERQKASGAEGDRLKEASNINKSLSTLGHVIMVLADLANGRQRHVPYRDSKLTFLLQDSLGGNSKTMIIANVNPSICSANETLSTLKFAQRAKIIQNNAVVNEDASGDVLALQHQIHLLKEELSMLKRQNVSRSLHFRAATLENGEYDVYSPPKLAGFLPNFNQMHDNEELCSFKVSNRKLKSIEAVLAGALRREKMADASMRQLEAEIEQLNRLVCQREEDTHCSKMMIKFREDKIYRMEALLNGLIPSESYLLEENNALYEEIKLLQSKVDKNPEVTRFALENIRLLAQLRKFQDFYEEGERDILLVELSELRNQLGQILDGKSKQKHHSKSDLNVQCFSSSKEDEFLRFELDRMSHELDDCRSSLKSCLEINAKLTREVNSLNTILKNTNVSTIEPNSLEPQMDFCLAYPKHGEVILNLELELDILKTIIGEEKSSRLEAEQRAIRANTELNIAKEELLQISTRCYETVDKLKDARSVIEALESQQIISINELEELRENYSQLEDVKKNREQEISSMRKQLDLHNDVGNRTISAHESLKKRYSESDSSPLKEKLIKVQASLEKAWNLNQRYQNDQAHRTTNEKEMDDIRMQVEAETAEVIVCLQEELAALNQLVDENSKNQLLAKKSLTDLENERKEQDDKLCWLTLENTRLSKFAQEKEQNVRSIMADWEQLALEIADVLETGSAQLDNASYEVASISDTFSHKSWICEQFGKIIQGVSKRDSLIEELQKNLEDAYNARHDMEWKLRSLRGATLAITEAQQQESSDKERRILHLTSMLDEKMSIISELENKVEHTEKKVWTVKECAIIFFLMVNRLYDINKIYLQALDEANMKLRESEKVILKKDAIIQEHISLLVNEDKECHVLKEHLEKNSQKEDSLELQQTLCLDSHHNNEERSISQIGTCGLVEAKLMLQEFQMQINTLKSCMHEYSEKGSNLTEAHSHGKHTLDNSEIDYEDQANIGSARDATNYEQNSVHCMIDNSVCKMSIKSEHRQLPENTLEREKTIEILRKEITSALQSLKEVQSQMAGMFEEKEEMKKFMLLSKNSTKDLIAEVGRLSSEILNKEKDFEFKFLQLEQKLQNFEGSATEINCLWTKEMEELNHEIKNLKDAAAMKTVETSNLLNKIEQAQETMGEADFMVNALMEANGIAKLEIDRLKKIEISLYHENSCLVSKLHVLQASLDEKDESLDCIQKNFKVNLMEAMDLVFAVEDQFMSLKDDFVDSNWVECKEADAMANDVLIKANEISKVEIDRLKKTEISLFHENCCLLSKLDNLQASLDEKDESLAHIQKNFKSNLKEVTDLVLAVDDQFRSIKDAFIETMALIHHDLNWLKSWILQHKEKLKEAKIKAKKNETVSTEIQRKLLLENDQLKLQVEQMKRMLHEEFQKGMADITHAKELEYQMAALKEQLEMAESLAEENEAVATEARQIAEERKTYAQVKEEEVRLLSRSVEELECTINALQEQVRIVKEEAERQVRSSNDGWNATKHFKEKMTELEEAQHSIQILQKEAAEKELEIVQCKSIISELNIHAEAQAKDYKRKFKELEDMAFQVKSNLITPNTTSLIPTKIEKGTGKSRGSGSPFKCIGLGVAQQINTEKDEELTSARYKIEELEALAASRQKQIFMLNIRLASAESMTHDVLRDLLGIKLDMTNYAEMSERSCSGNSVMEKDKEWGKLKKQVDEFVEERQSLLEEINQRHKELIAAQIRLEKLQGQKKLLSTENELLKADNVKYKNIVMELEEELEKTL